MASPSDDAAKLAWQNTAKEKMVATRAAIKAGTATAEDKGELLATLVDWILGPEA